MEEKPISIREFGRKYCDENGKTYSDTSIRFYIRKNYITEKSIVINPKNRRPQIIENIAVNELRNNFKSDWGKSTIATGETKANIEKVKKQASENNGAEIEDITDDNSEIKAAKNDTLIHIKLKVEKVKLRRDNLELKAREGELVNNRDVQKAVFEIGNTVKQAFQSLPSQIIDDVMAAPDRNTANDIMMGGINNILSQIADSYKLQLKR